MNETIEEVIETDLAHSGLLVSKEIREITAICGIYLFSTAYTLC